MVWNLPSTFSVVKVSRHLFFSQAKATYFPLQSSQVVSCNYGFHLCDDLKCLAMSHLSWQIYSVIEFFFDSLTLHPSLLCIDIKNVQAFYVYIFLEVISLEKCHETTNIYKCTQQATKRYPKNNFPIYILEHYSEVSIWVQYSNQPPHLALKKNWGGLWIKKSMICEKKLCFWKQ